MASVPKPTRAKYLVTATRRANQTATELRGLCDLHTPPDEQGRPKIQKSQASSAVPFTPPPKTKKKLEPAKKAKKEDATGAIGTSASAANTNASQVEGGDGTMETGSRKRSRGRPKGPDDTGAYLVHYLVPEPRPTRAKHLVMAMTSSGSKQPGATEPSELTIIGTLESNSICHSNNHAYQQWSDTKISIRKE